MKAQKQETCHEVSVAGAERAKGEERGDEGDLRALLRRLGVGGGSHEGMRRQTVK